MAREVDGEVLLLDSAADRVHQLNATASYIWNMCDGTKTVAEMASALEKQFHIGHDRAQKDVLDTVAALKGLKLIEEA